MQFCTARSKPKSQIELQEKIAPRLILTAKFEHTLKWLYCCSNNNDKYENWRYTGLKTRWKSLKYCRTIHGFENLHLQKVNRTQKQHFMKMSENFWLEQKEQQHHTRVLRISGKLLEVYFLQNSSEGQPRAWHSPCWMSKNTLELLNIHLFICFTDHSYTYRFQMWFTSTVLQSGQCGASKFQSRRESYSEYNVQHRQQQQISWMGSTEW